MNRLKTRFVRKLKEKALTGEQEIEILKQIILANEQEPVSPFLLMDYNRYVKTPVAQQYISDHFNSIYDALKLKVENAISDLSTKSFINDSDIEAIHPNGMYNALYEALKKNVNKTNCTVPKNVVDSVACYFQETGIHYTFMVEPEPLILQFLFYSDSNPARLEAARKLIYDCGNEFIKNSEEHAVDFLACVYNYLFSKNALSTQALVTIIENFLNPVLHDLKDVAVKQLISTNSLTPQIAYRIYRYIYNPETQKSFIEQLKRSLNETPFVHSKDFLEYSLNLHRHKTALVLSGFPGNITERLLVISPYIRITYPYINKNESFFRVIGFNGKNPKNSIVCFGFSNKLLALRPEYVQECIEETDTFFPGLG